MKVSNLDKGDLIWLHLNVTSHKDQLRNLICHGNLFPSEFEMILYRIAICAQKSTQKSSHIYYTYLPTYVHILLTCKYFRNKILATASDNLPGLPPPILQSFQLSSVFSFFSKIRCHHRKVCILWPMIIDPSSLAVLNFIIIIDHSEIVVVVERWVGGGVRFCQREWQWAGTYVRWLRRRITLFL